MRKLTQHIILLIALTPSVLWAQYFREPKLTLEQRQEIVYHSLQGDTTNLYKLRMVRYPKDLPQGVDTVDFQANERSPRMRLYRPIGNSQTLPLLVYAHGGGWMMGSLEDCEPFLSQLCKQGNMAVLSVDYRLSPEFQFPYPLYDVVAALDFAYQKWDELLIDTTRISIGGEEAGANLAIASLFISTHKPQSLVLLNPIVKGEADNGVSWQRYGKGFGLLSRTLELCYTAYLPDEALSQDPLISPIDAADYQLQMLPHTAIVSSEYDILEDQSLQFVERLRALGVAAERILLTGVSHLFLNNPDNYYEIEKTINYFIKQINY